MIDSAIAGDLFNVLREHFQRHGYWTVAIVLLLENMGLPVPGETTLLFASFLAYSQHELQLPWIIAVGILAAVAGDNLGFAAGHFGGRRFTDKYLRVLRAGGGAIERGRQFFERHGAVTIFFARFVAGLRVVAGPLAGTLCMPWRKFFFFNILGAAAWVTAMASIGYFFGGRLEAILHGMGRANAVIIGALIVGGALWWWRRRRADAHQGGQP